MIAPVAVVIFLSLQSQFNRGRKMNTTFKAKIQTLIFIAVAVSYVVIILLTLGMASQINKESNTLRQLYFLKYCETEVLRKVCLKACLEEVPKIGAYLIRVNQAQQKYDEEK